MKKSIFIFLILFIILLIKAEEPNPNAYISDPFNNPNFKFSNDNTTFYVNDTKFFDYLQNITLSDEEIDKFLFCGALLQIKISHDLKIINEIANEIKGINANDAYDKMGSYLLENCLNKVSLRTAQKHFYKGIYIEEITNEYFDYYHSYHDVDYNSIFKNKDAKDLKRSNKDLEYLFRFQKAHEIHTKRQEEDRQRKIQEERDSNEKMKAVGFDLLSLPSYVKIIIFILVFGALFGGSLYYVNSIINKPKKEKKKKKKTQ